MADVTLEELELADKSKAWDITLGFPVPESRMLQTLKAVTNMLSQPSCRY